MSVEFKDYYAILGVPRDATAEDIKKAFRKLARRYHPDVASDKSGAEAKFKEINEAHEVLGDPEKRRKYDQLGMHWRDGGAAAAADPQAQSHEFHFSGTGFSDFFERYFSGASRYGFPEEVGGGGRATARGAARERRGSDIEGDILVTIEEAMHGAVRPISLRITDPASGRIETHEFQIRIPAGVAAGRRIRVAGQGEPGGQGGPPGDLYLRVRLAAHPDFSVRGSDIFHELEITPWEAALGAEVRVPTLEGPVTLRVPPGSQHGGQLRLRGRGLPVGKAGGRGDFHAVLAIRMPEELSPEERAAWEQVRTVSRFNPRTRRG